VTLEIRKGDFILVFGPSGSGKSTLFYALSGLIPWSIPGFIKGSIEILGKNLLFTRPNQVAGTIGFLMQNPDSQFVNLKVYDELVFGAENLKVPKEIINTRLEKIVKLLNLKDLLDRNVVQLSGGEKQRVVLGSILMMNPKILLLDEPMAFLDGAMRIELLNYLLKLQKEYNNEIAILISEHRISELLPYINKFMTVNKGEVLIHPRSANLNWSYFYPDMKESINFLKEASYGIDFNNGYNYENLINQCGFTEEFNNLVAISQEKPLLELRDISFDYVQDIGKNKKWVLNKY
jgi:energy-coupling factor transporter ATP-binding protein EcfA2